MDGENDKDLHATSDSVWPVIDRPAVNTVFEKPKKLSFFGKVNEAIQQTKNAIGAVADHKNTKAAIEWSKQTGTELIDQATVLGSDILHSDLGKAATKGAAIGAVAAVPIPIIGPVAGAIVGAGVGGYLNVMHGIGKSQEAVRCDLEVEPVEQVQSADVVIASLLKLDELRKAGILNDAEFQEQKDKLLKRI